MTEHLYQKYFEWDLVLSLFILLFPYIQSNELFIENRRLNKGNFHLQVAKLYLKAYGWASSFR